MQALDLVRRGRKRKMRTMSQLGPDKLVTKPLEALVARHESLPKLLYGHGIL